MDPEYINELLIRLKAEADSNKAKAEREEAERKRKARRGGLDGEECDLSEIT